MISVIIPAYNAAKTIDNCLRALLNQTVSRSEYEIIVIDDGSTDDTPQIVGSYKDITLIRQENQGPAVARNQGAKQASGDIILFTDSDCTPVADWIEKMIAPFNRDESIAGVKGVYRTDQKELVARFVQLEYEDKYDVMKKQKYIDFIDTYSAGFRREAFCAIGGYDTSFPVACAEDVEMSFRLANAGYKMIMVPDAVVYHIHPNTLTAYLKKKFKFACWRMLAVKKNPNKIARDSHTPQLMKLQLLFLPLLLFSVILVLLGQSILFPVLVVLLFCASAVPFVVKALQKDMMVGIVALPCLMLRSVSQLWGVIYGIFFNMCFSTSCNKT